MTQIPAMLLVLVVMVGLLILGDLCAHRITAWLSRRFPDLPEDREAYMLWGTVVVIAFAFGLLVMYLLLRH